MVDRLLGLGCCHVQASLPMHLHCAQAEHRR
jgi:hypothetical protein